MGSIMGSQNIMGSDHGSNISAPNSVLCGLDRSRAARGCIRETCLPPSCSTHSCAK